MSVDTPRGQRGGDLPAQAGTTLPDLLTEAAFDDHHPPSPELVADCVHCGFCLPACPTYALWGEDRKSTRLNSSHVKISYAVFCLKKKKTHRCILYSQETQVS